MRARSATVATAVLAMALPVAAHTTAAHAGQSFQITVPDPEVQLKETFTVNGSGAPCTGAPYTVTFAYTDHDGNQATLQETGTTGGDGEFSEVVTVPEAATPDQPANVQASVTCSSPSPTSTSTSTSTVTPNPTADAAAQPQGAQRFGGGGTTSNTVAITIVVATGVLSTDKTQGRAGTVVHVTGTNCLGDDVVAVFGNSSGADDVPVTLAANDTFAGDYEIPDVPPGSYFFAAACPGTDYQDVAFTVLETPGSNPTPLPPPSGVVDFTG